MKRQTKFKDTEIGKIPEDWDVEVFSNIIAINPKRDIKKGTTARKISMQNLIEFKRKIDGFELSEFKGGSKFQNEDTLMARITPCLENGKTAYVDILEDNEIAFGSTEFIVLSGKDNLTRNDFVYYLAISPKIRRIAIQSMTGTSGRQRIQADLLGDVEIGIPSIEEQTSIAKILSDLDSKIELLQKQNKNLEAIGQALFKHWFIDFEFPNEEGKPYKSSGGEMVDSELGAIPKDWKVNQLNDFGDIICGKTPPKSNKEYFEGDIPFIKIPDMHNQLFVINTEDSLTKEGKEYQENKTIPEKSICVSCIATVGLVSLTSKESQTNQQINSIIPKNSYSTYYLHYMLKSMYQLLQDYGSGGSATLNINTKTFSKIKVLSPKDEVIKEFYKKVNSIFDKILNNLNENNILSQIRDSLLPKLMSGKIRVKEFA